MTRRRLGFATLLTVSAALHVAVLAGVRLPEPVTTNPPEAIRVRLQAPTEAPTPVAAPPINETVPPETSAQEALSANAAPKEPVTSGDEKAAQSAESFELPDANIAPRNVPAAPVTSELPIGSEPGANPVAADPGVETVVVAWLERHKRYPRTAIARRLEGEVLLRLVLTSKGGVITAQIDRGSGHGLLDREVLNMVERSAPFPIAGFLDQDMLFIIPIDFTLE